MSATRFAVVPLAEVERIFAGVDGTRHFTAAVEKAPENTSVEKVAEKKELRAPVARREATR